MTSYGRWSLPGRSESLRIAFMIHHRSSWGGGRRDSSSHVKTRSEHMVLGCGGCDGYSKVQGRSDASAADRAGIDLSEWPHDEASSSQAAVKEGLATRIYIHYMDEIWRPLHTVSRSPS